jgi:transcriptional regulator of heat shock response
LLDLLIGEEWLKKEAKGEEVDLCLKGAMGLTPQLLQKKLNFLNSQMDLVKSQEIAKMM